MRIESVRPIRNQVLVQLLEKKNEGIEKTESGILIYAKTKSKRNPMMVRILALGSTYQSNGIVVPVEEVLKVGDLGLVFPGALIEEIYDESRPDDRFFLIRTEDIDAIIEED